MDLFSVKMRASSPVDHKLGGNHISGGELITNKEMLKHETLGLVDRALNHSRGQADFINISIQKILNPDEIKYVTPLPITTIDKNDNPMYPNLILKSLGFSEDKISKSLTTLLKLKNLRGALLISIDDFEEFHSKIVRCTNMDYAIEIKQDLKSFLQKNNFLGKYLKDALCISSKICKNENVLCEICISDDKNYTTGYIASKDLGYIRIKNFKPKDHKYGGRIIFIKDKNKIDSTIDYLKNSIVIINSIPVIRKNLRWLNV